MWIFGTSKLSLVLSVKGMFSVQKAPTNHYAQCMLLLCVFDLAAALLLQGQAKWNEMKLTLASFFVVDTIGSLFLLSMSLEWQPTSWLNLPVAPRNRRENSGHRLCIIMVCLALAANCHMLIYAHYWELVMSVGCHGSLSLLFIHCYSWWARWQSDTLWTLTLIRLLWLHSVLCDWPTDIVVDLFQ